MSWYIKVRAHYARTNSAAALGINAAYSTAKIYHWEEGRQTSRDNCGTWTHGWQDRLGDPVNSEPAAKQLTVKDALPDHHCKHMQVTDMIHTGQRHASTLQLQRNGASQAHLVQLSARLAASFLTSSQQYYIQPRHSHRTV